MYIAPNGRHGNGSECDEIAIDLISNTTKYVDDGIDYESNDGLFQDTVVIIVVVSILILGCICFCIYWLRNEKLIKTVKIQKGHEQKIRNPMVIMLGIAYYKHTRTKSAILGTLKDLDGVDVDFFNVKKLCKTLNYDFYPKYEKLAWNQKEIMNFLKECAEKAANPSSNYDSIIFIHSGHGWKQSVMTSDYQCIHKTAIHRLFSVNYPKLRDKPRISIYDCCDGNYERGTDSKYSALEFQQHLSNPNPGKNVGSSMKNVLFRESLKNKDIWCRDDSNPDYKLVTIHAANTGFQSKLS